jgi:nicotinamide-nucleotide amidase
MPDSHPLATEPLAPTSPSRASASPLLPPDSHSLASEPQAPTSPLRAADSPPPAPASPLLASELPGLADQIGQLLMARHETVAIAESSAGGLISAALLTVPGASAYFVGGAVVYTRAARERFGATWALGETGATGPTGNRYGDSPGHACLALTGPSQRSLTLETALADRMPNMHAFAAQALRLLLDALLDPALEPPHAQAIKER